MSAKPKNSVVVSLEIKHLIYHYRNKAVMLDKDLARLYNVTTAHLKRAVKRNLDRFPQDFMFKLSMEEASRCQIGTLKRGKNVKYLPFVFTEQGVSMLSAVLKSQIAVQISIQIIRAFVRLRTILAENVSLRYAIEGIERRMGKNERDIQIAIQTIRKFLEPPVNLRNDRVMGFVPPKKLLIPQKNDISKKERLYVSKA
jgi:hypothetical protein